MIVVIEKNTYAGDGCEQTASYTVSGLYGPFTDAAAATTWINAQPKSYAVEYEIETVTVV